MCPSAWCRNICGKHMLSCCKSEPATNDFEGDLVKNESHKNGDGIGTSNIWMAARTSSFAVPRPAPSEEGTEVVLGKMSERIRDGDDSTLFIDSAAIAPGSFAAATTLDNIEALSA